MVTTCPTRPVPTNVGVPSLAVPPSATWPSTGSRLSSARTTDTALSAVSSVIATVRGSLRLPAGSCATTLSVCSPSANATVGVTLQRPSGPTTALPKTTAALLTNTRAPGSAPVPLTVGAASSVCTPICPTPAPSTPRKAPTSSNTSKTTPEGAEASTTITRSPLRGPSSPSTLLALAAMRCSPSARSSDSSNRQRPLASANTASCGSPSIHTVTHVHGMATPLTTGRRSSVVWCCCRAPWINPTSSNRPSIDATDKRASAIIIGHVSDQELTEASLTARTRMLRTPVGHPSAGVKVQRPSTTAASPIF